jgi:hypothetical protein
MRDQYAGDITDLLQLALLRALVEESETPKRDCARSLLCVCPETYRL